MFRVLKGPFAVGARRMGYVLTREESWCTNLLFSLPLSDWIGDVKRTMLLHNVQELDDDLGGRTDEDLTLSGLLGVVDGVQAVVENGSLDHFGDLRKL
jgi:hypothetical protein